MIKMNKWSECSITEIKKNAKHRPRALKLKSLSVLYLFFYTTHAFFNWESFLALWSHGHCRSKGMGNTQVLNDNWIMNEKKWLDGVLFKVIPELYSYRVNSSTPGKLNSTWNWKLYFHKVFTGCPNKYGIC